MSKPRPLNDHDTPLKCDEPLGPRAKNGDLEALKALLRIIEAQCQLMGLAPDLKKDPRAAWTSCVGPATVVIHPDDCRHQGCAKHGTFSSPPVAS